MESHQGKIGLIDGMGPYAGAYFFKLLIEKSSRDFGAKNNNDYPEILLNSIPVPDFISDTNNLDKAKLVLLERARILDELGADAIGMVCNTAHVLYPDLAAVTHGKLLSMIELVAERASKLELRRIGVLATQTTITTKLYEEALLRRGLVSVNADENMQMIHEVIIRQLVAGKKSISQTELLRDMTKRFVEKEKLDGLILGCTELPLVFPKNEFVNVIDCLEVLADELLFRYYSKEHHEGSKR